MINLAKKEKHKKAITTCVKNIVRLYDDLNYPQIDSLKQELTFLVYNAIYNEINELQNEKKHIPKSDKRGG